MLELIQINLSSITLLSDFLCLPAFVDCSSLILILTASAPYCCWAKCISLIYCDPCSTKQSGLHTEKKGHTSAPPRCCQFYLFRLRWFGSCARFLGVVAPAVVSIVRASFFEFCSPSLRYCSLLWFSSHSGRCLLVPPVLCYLCMSTIPVLLRIRFRWPCLATVGAFPCHGGLSCGPT